MEKSIGNMKDEGWEWPLYSSDLEPQELKRLRCSVCAVEWAHVQCHQCNRQLCTACETEAHATVSNPTTHQDYSEPCNVCQDCQTAGPDFYCRDCMQHQCELCCVATHNRSDTMHTHVWFSTEGAPARLGSHSIWEGRFRQYTKMVHRRLLHTMNQSYDVVKQEAGVLPDYLPLTPANDDEDTSDEEERPSDVPNETLAPSPAQERVDIKTERLSAEPTPVEEAVEVKMERVRLTDPDQTPNSAPASEEPILPPPPPPSVETPALGIKTEPLQLPRVSSRPVNPQKDIVDLTGDDDDDDENDGSSATTTAPSVLVKTERPPLTSPDFVSAFADEDLIRTAMIREYNTLSQQVIDMEHQRAQLSQRAARGSVQDMLACKEQLDGLKDKLVQATTNRHATIARLLAYVHDEELATKVRRDTTLDIPDAQTAYHRRLREIQISIDQQLVTLHTAKRQMNEVVSMKSGDNYAEVVRLGTEISTLEQQIQTLEIQRLDAFLQFAHVSVAVRSAALALVAPQTNVP